MIAFFCLINSSTDCPSMFTFNAPCAFTTSVSIKFCANCSTNDKKCSFLVTKSVSALTSNSIAWSSLILSLHMPFDATLFVVVSCLTCDLIWAKAWSKSSLNFSNALLHSSIPAPVVSLNFFNSLISIYIPQTFHDYYILFSIYC